MTSRAAQAIGWVDYLSKIDPPILAWMITAQLVDEWPLQPRGKWQAKWINEYFKQPEFVNADAVMQKNARAELKRRVLAGEGRPEINPCPWEPRGWYN